MNQMTLDLRIDSHCRIGRIRFKRHRGREERKDKASIKAALNATTAALTRARDLKSIGRGEGR
jgi:ABC-type cobalamin/Fe3+-siderophores transport system ATPase subunit